MQIVEELPLVKGCILKLRLLFGTTLNSAKAGLTILNVFGFLSEYDFLLLNSKHLLDLPSFFSVVLAFELHGLGLSYCEVKGALLGVLSNLSFGFFLELSVVLLALFN